MSGKVKYLCCIFNYAPHYRLPIFEKIDKECKAHFYFGDRLLNNEHIEKLDYSKLDGYQAELKVGSIKLGRHKLEYTKGWLGLAVSPRYKQYLITPNQFALNQWLFLLLCFILRKEVYVWMHGLQTSQNPRRTLVVWRIYDLFLRGSFLYGNHAKRNMQKLGFDERKFHLIYNSLNYDTSKALRQSALENPYESRFGDKAPILIFIGRLTAVKKLHMLVQAVDLLKQRGVIVNVAFVGEGPEQSRLQQAIADADRERFWFVGPLYDEREIARYLYYADVCVSPGNVGLTGIHALSYGVPVITNDNFEVQMPEFEAVEQGSTGDFFKENDACSLADRIESWLRRNVDREQVRNQCYEVIDTKYNPAYQVEVVKKVLGL
ncbi:MAG: glycosyltransferase family 4 protein [Rikenellaceae bacterium]|nr:glycosyltransferase family 4 protein [Rikenellaceae bacterium]